MCTLDNMLPAASKLAVPCEQVWVAFQTKTFSNMPLALLWLNIWQIMLPLYFDLSQQESTGGIKNINAGCIPFIWASMSTRVLCMLTQWHGLMTLNRTEPSLTLPVPPVLFLPWQVKISVVKRFHYRKMGKKKHKPTCSHGGEHTCSLLIVNKSPVFIISSRKQRGGEQTH